MPESLKRTVTDLFRKLESSGIRYAVLRNYEQFPSMKSSSGASGHTDIDLAVNSHDLEELRSLLAEIADANGWDVLSECDHWTQSKIRPHNIEVFHFTRTNPLEFLQIDVFHGVLIWGLPIFDQEQMLEGRVYDAERGLSRIDPRKENVHRILQIHGLYPGAERKRARYRTKVLAFRTAHREALDTTVNATLPFFGVRALDALERDDVPAFIRNMSYARTWFTLRYAVRHLPTVPRILVCRLRENIKRYLTRQCGVVIRTAVRDEAHRQQVREAMDELVRNSFMDEWIEHEAGERRTIKDCVAMEQGAITIQWTDGDSAQLDLRGTRSHQEILDTVVHYLSRRHKQLYARDANERLLPLMEASAR